MAAPPGHRHGIRVGEAKRRPQRPEVVEQSRRRAGDRGCGVGDAAAQAGRPCQGVSEQDDAQQAERVFEADRHTGEEARGGDQSQPERSLAFGEQEDEGGEPQRG